MSLSWTPKYRTGGSYASDHLFGRSLQRVAVLMALAGLLVVLHLGMPAHAAPPPDANSQYRDWFRSLTIPGSANIGCCTVADCRMVESRWNNRTQHYEAKVIRDVFSNALQNSPLYETDLTAFQAAKRVWIDRWITSYGDVPHAWIEIPEPRINRAANPTGRAVLCWSTFYPDFNGVFCFVPFEASFNEEALVKSFS